MNTTTPGDRGDYEAAINALIDGELDEREAAALKAAADGDPALARAIVDAWNLQKGLDGLQLEHPPARLTRRLRRIPAEQRRAGGWSPRPRRIAVGATASVALAAFAMMMTSTRSGPEPGVPDPAELARVEAARRDLAIAFHYLDKVGERTGRHLGGVLHDDLAEPVTESLIRHMPYTGTSRKEENS